MRLMVLLAPLAATIACSAATARTSPPCASLRGTTIARDHQFRIFTRHRYDVQLFGCSYRTRNVVRVYPADGDDGGLCGTFSLARLRGRMVAVAFDSCGGGGSYYRQFIVVRDASTLKTFRRVHSRPDEAVTTTGLLVKRDGAVGWIWKDCGPIDLPDGSCFSVVHKADRTGSAALDSGDIDPNSLALHGSRMAWTNAGRRHSAKLH